MPGERPARGKLFSDKNLKTRHRPSIFPRELAEGHAAALLFGNGAPARDGRCDGKPGSCLVPVLAPSIPPTTTSP